MPTQLEEVIPDTHRLHVEHLRPNIGQGLLQLSVRCHVVIALQLANLDLGQRLAVQFAVGVQWQLLQPQPVQRHHVFRQLRTQMLFDLIQMLTQINGCLRSHPIPHQVLAIRAFLHADGRVAQLRQFMKPRFDFTQFNAIAADFHLVVDTAHVLQYAVHALARQITGAVQTLASSAKRVGHKHGRRAQRITDIAAPHARAGHT